MTSHKSEWPSKPNQQKTSAGEVVEKREPQCTVGLNKFLIIDVLGVFTFIEPCGYGKIHRTNFFFRDNSFCLCIFVAFEVKYTGWGKNRFTVVCMENNAIIILQE